MYRHLLGILAMTTVFSTAAQAELIVLAAPRTGDPYYADVDDEIFNFHVEYANRVRKAGDDVLILTDQGGYNRYANALGKRFVSVNPQLDIWARDFGTSNAIAPVMFRYTSAAQGGGRSGQGDADAVQEVLAVSADRASLPYLASDWLNDGGNFVEDGFGNAVVSRKFLRDNRLSETRARRVLLEEAGIQNVAFIESDEQGGLEHADGVVSFVDRNTLMVNSYPEDPAFQRELEQALREGLPGVSIHRITTPYDGSEIYDDRFGSACGLYTNALVTPLRVYLPQFGIPQDALAIEQVQAATNKQIVPVPSSQVCHMGGGVRCMSWQLRGTAASRMASFFRR